MSSNTEATRNWPELAIGLFEKLTQRGAEICYDFRQLEVEVPSGVGRSAEHAVWKINGVLNIRACESSEHLT